MGVLQHDKAIVVRDGDVEQSLEDLRSEEPPPCHVARRDHRPERLALLCVRMKGEGAVLVR